MTQLDNQPNSIDCKTPSLTTRPAVYVRMPKPEYQSLAKDALLLGKSLPETLRDGYFQGGGGVTVLMAKDDQRDLMVALSRIGNNVNQIARRMNGGVKHIAASEFTNLQEEFAKLNALVRAFSSRAQSKKWL